MTKTNNTSLIHEEQCSIDTEGFILNDINVGPNHANKTVLASVYSLDGKLLKKENMVTNSEGLFAWDILIQSSDNLVKVKVYA